jgi:acetylornithine/N-succinyldiaminopimelate aminotransferase
MNRIERDKNAILNTYKRLPIVIDRAEGHELIDENGVRYLDFFSGIAVNNLGHDPEVVKAIHEQVDRYLHLSNYFASEPAVELAELLVDNSFASKVFFTNSGAESVEAAIKMVRKWGKANGKMTMLSANGAFHGRTMGALGLTAKPNYQEPFMPLLFGIAHFEMNDIDSIRERVNADTAAVFLEMIQGEGGVRPIDQVFMDEIIRLREEFGFLLVVDEIQTGLGRTGTLFAYEQYGIVPDLVCTAKALGGGLPLGGLLVSEALTGVWVPGNHGTTFGGNPVASAAGIALVTKLLEVGFLDEVNRKSRCIVSGLEELNVEFPGVIREIRGFGMMIGVDVGEAAPQLQEAFLKRHCLVNTTSGTVLRLIPALNIGDEEIQQFLDIFREILKERA